MAKQVVGGETPTGEGPPPGWPVKLEDPESCLMIYFDDAIDGLGLKALKVIRAGQQVVEYTGILMSLEQYANLPDRSEHVKYAIIGSNFCISALKAGNLARFVNHSCHDWNLKLEVTPQIDRLPAFKLVATRDIQPGEKLTFNYGNWNRSQFECKCKSKEHTR